MAKRTYDWRTDPEQNKSLAVRLVLRDLKNAPATEVVESVQNRYGHKVSPQFIYLLKNVDRRKKAKKSGRRVKAVSFSPENINGETILNGLTDFLEATKAAKRLVRAAGSYETAQQVLSAFKD